MAKKITSKNYFSEDNTYLSASMIKTFMKCPHRFKQMYFDKTVKFEQTPSMQLGSMVDMIATESLRKFKMNYTPKVLKKENKKLFASQKDTRREVITPAQYETALGMAESLMKTDAFKDIESHDSQVVLNYNMDIGHGFTGIGGMLDKLYIDEKNKIAIITDLKTSAAFGTPDRYYWKCEDFGYFISMAQYRKLVYLNFPEIEDVICQHIVVVNDRDKIYPVHTFKFTQTEINNAETILDQRIDMIAKEKEFLPRNVGWDDAINIGQSDEEDL